MKTFREYINEDEIISESKYELIYSCNLSGNCKFWYATNKTSGVDLDMWFDEEITDKGTRRVLKKWLKTQKGEDNVYEIFKYKLDPWTRDETFDIFGGILKNKGKYYLAVNPFKEIRVFETKEEAIEFTYSD